MMRAFPMALSQGTRLGPYKIQSAIGSGGMGEVYRARDTKLDRDVAIKVLPTAFATDPDRLARFTREAKTLAALNHPNIAAIYGIQDNALVMELVEGQDLSTLTSRGPMPLSDALSIARQIADALEAAHDLGIIHRDLKPANIKVRADGAVKVLDFGLAKAMTPTPGSDAAAALANSPTITAPAFSELGIILGTAAYMSPEQAAGKAADKRSDLWSFGVVLFEMLTGRRLFTGETVSHVLAEVLKAEPDWTMLPAGTPTAVRRLLRRCLEKDRRRRIADASDVRLELEEALGPNRDGDVLTTVQAMAIVPAWRRALPWALTLTFAAALIAALVIQPPWRDDSAPVSRITLSMSRDNSLAIQNGVAISPDGRTIAFGARSAGVSQLYVRRLDEWAPTAVPLTEGAVNPFFSPDGEWIAFRRSGNLEKVRLSGGAPQLLTKATGSDGGRWLPNGTIVFGTYPDVALRQVSAEGGASQVIVESTEGSGVQYQWPEPLPDNRGTVFGIREKGQSRIAVLAPGSAAPRMLIAAGSHPRYLPSGHLLYIDGGQLLAVSFDIDRLEIRGGGVVVMSDLRTATFDVSATGALVYVPAGSSESRVVWRDRNGGTIPVVQQRAQYANPALSADGTTFSVVIQQGSSRNIWTGRVADGLLTRLTVGNDDVFGVWSRDGARLYYTAGQDGTYNIFSILTDGNGRAERLTETPHPQQATSWSPLGDTLLFHEIDPASQADIWEFSMASGKARPVLQTPSSEGSARFSPDGRWIAYDSNETGPFEIYVRAYPGPAVKRRISPEGGVSPFWSHTGEELFYQTATAVFSMPVLDPRDLRLGAPVRLFAHSGGRLAISADDQRFLTLEKTDASMSTSQVNVVLNWFQDLKIRMAQK